MSCINVGNDIRKNWVLVCCLIFFLGMLSLSFFGRENKIIRIVFTLLIYVIILYQRKKIINDSILIAFSSYVIFCMISILFSQNVMMCGFKLLELIIMLVLISGGVEKFKIGTKYNLFQVLLYYYIFQSVVALIGYFTDPTTVAEDTGYGAYVTFLSCKFPPIHSNALGSFCGYGALTSFTLYILSKKEKKRFPLSVIYFIFFMLCVYTMYLCSSRTGMISFVIGFIFLFHYVIKIKVKILVLVISVILGTIYINKIADVVKLIIMKKQTEEILSSSEDEVNALTSGRIGMWEYVLEHPERCILGQGYGTGFLSMWENGETDAGNAHNSMIEILYNTGIFALVFWLRIWWLGYKRFKWLMQNKKKLPLNIDWYYLAGAIFLFSFVRSIGNLNFVYFQLDSFAPMAVIILFIYSTQYIKCQNKLAE